MEILKKILKWVFGIFFTIAGIGGLFTDPIVGIIFLLVGLFILPPTFNLLEDKTSVNFSSKTKWATVSIGLILGVVAVSMVDLEQDKEADLIVEKASEFVRQGKIDSARTYLEKAKEVYISQNNNATKLENELQKADSVEFAIETLIEMTDSEFEKLEKDSLNKAYLDHKTLNKKFIALMKANASERVKHLKEIEERKRQERLEAERKRQEELKEEREELVRDQFSPWDGSHPALTKLIKKKMRDPDSYDHIETRFRDDGNSIFVITKFRGANAFGGKVINTVTATVDFEGNVIEIKSWN